MSKKNKRNTPRPASAPAAGRSTEFNPDYSTTRRELRRIGILAGTFLVILVVLSLFQKQILALFVK